VVNGRTRNFWKGRFEGGGASTPEQQPISTEEEPWFWEGNVQGSIAQFLIKRGYSIIHIADPRRREKGKDIEAENHVGLLWVTVKGYPKGTLKTHPSTQAAIWFKDAFFDVVSWRGERKDVTLAVGLPDFPRYRRLAEKVLWLQPTIRFSFIWVSQSGQITLEGDL